MKVNNILIEIFGDMLENPDFEQEYWSRAAKAINKIGHDSIRLMKWLIFLMIDHITII